MKGQMQFAIPVTARREGTRNTFKKLRKEFKRSRRNNKARQAVIDKVREAMP